MTESDVPISVSSDTFQIWNCCLDSNRLHQQFSRLGNTPFRLETLTNNLEGNVMLPVSELNRLRRTLVDHLLEARSRPKAWTLHPTRTAFDLLLKAEGRRMKDEGKADFGVSAQSNAGRRQKNPPLAPPKRGTEPKRASEPTPSPSQEGNRTSPTLQLPNSSTSQLPNSPTPQSKIQNPKSPTLIPLVRTFGQLTAALEAGIKTIYCELEHPQRYKEAVRLVREKSDRNGIDHEIWVAPPRITKAAEKNLLALVLKCQADGYLVRNYDHLAYFGDQRCVGDFSLNVANPITASYFLQEFNLERLTASYDLNIQQLDDLLTACPEGWFEVTLHQHMPMFHMEHCVFCTFLSEGTDSSNCGRPCDRYEVELRDRTGAQHILHADAGCRNTVYNSRAQTGAEFTHQLIKAGLRYVRVEFLKESGAEVKEAIAMYQNVIDGAMSGTEVWKRLKLQNQLGVTRGQL
ncbi:MAG: DUF3656 domain-containing protein [Cyanobacteria bacterium P01_F01_bin.150]